jgi:hypothetical protein
MELLGFSHRKIKKISALEKKIASEARLQAEMKGILRLGMTVGWTIMPRSG